ncbi:putative general alpha-glucoside permease [Cadophora sp. MPI-SDFR-AT-0126]|nr:putative general alpha-glucoside permease [Leotiomycetes sp. MPI-SDFR-AT-0126]
MTGLIIAFPEFRKDYGHYYAPNKSYVVSAVWQSLWAAGNTIGVILGSITCALFLDVWGRKPIFLLAIILSIGTMFMLVFASSLPLLFGAKIVFGVASGCTLTVSPLYVAENAPKELRGTVLSMINLWIVFGQFIAAIIANSTQGIKGSWSYKASFALTAFFPAILLIGVWFLPESPAWLMAKERTEDARQSLRRLHGKSKEDRFNQILAELHLNLHTGSGESASIRECFRKNNRERTFLAIIVLSMQPLVGLLFILPYQTYFYQLSGLNRSFSIALGSTAAMLVACIWATIFSEVLGRRQLLVWGVGILVLWNAIIGFVSLAPTSNRPATFTAVAFVVSWPIFYQVSLGCVGWATASEIQTQRLRAKTISLANMVANFFSWLTSFTIPYLFNPDQANLGGKIMLIFLGLALPGFIYFVFRLPETQGRSFEDIDELYANGVSPRNFASTVLPPRNQAEKWGRGELDESA